jgi:putative transposase
MSRYRLTPTPPQEIIVAGHCSRARYVWNLAVEQQSWWRPGRGSAPGYYTGEVWIPKAGPGTGEVVGVDRGVVVSAALSTGELLQCPRLRPEEQARLRRLERRLARAHNGSSRRRRLKKTIAKLKARERDRRRDWAEKTSRSLARRFDVIRIEDLRIRSMTRSAHGTPARPGRRIRQKAGLNRGILASGWGLLDRRLTDKAPGRVEKINAARNIAAGHAVSARGRSPLGERENREPQPLSLSA